MIAGPANALADAVSLQKTISANESYIRRFRTEHDSLLKQPPDADTHKKLDNLKKKIQLLESENKRLKNFVAPTVPSVPAPVQPKVETPTQMPLLETQWVDTVPQKEPELHADEDVFYLGSDWLQMSMHEKERYIELANSQLARIGVLVTKHVFFYQMELDNALRDDPGLRSKKLDNLYMAQVYRHEEPNRDRLREFREEILVGHA